MGLDELFSWFKYFFQVQWQTLYCIEIWTNTRSPRSIQDTKIVLYKPCMCSFGAIVLLCWRTNFKAQVSENYMKVSSRIFFAAFILYSTLTSLPGPAVEKHPHSIMLPPPCFTVGMAKWWCVVVPILTVSSTTNFVLIHLFFTCLWSLLLTLRLTHLCF